AVHKQLTALAKAEEALDACEQLWPALHDRVAKWRERARPGRVHERLLRRSPWQVRARWALLGSTASPVDAGESFLFQVAQVFSETVGEADADAWALEVVDEAGSSNEDLIQHTCQRLSQYRDQQALAARARVYK